MDSISWFERMEIIEGVHWIEGINANCYIIAEADLLLIDTGFRHKTKKILRYITQVLHREPSELKMIVVTHCHLDHIGNADQLRVVTGAKIAAHQEDAVFIEGRKKAPVPAGGLGMVYRTLSPFIRIRRFPVDILLKEKDIIGGLAVLFIPGHTPGSIALYDTKRKVLFTGDALRYKNGVVEGPSKGFSIDITSAYSSLQQLKLLEYDIMLSGHGTPLTKNASVKVREFLEKHESHL
jgi:hydroxyacylglutathione hydrolase